MGWFSKPKPEYVEMSLEAYREQLGVAPGQPVCMPGRGRNLTGYRGSEDCGGCGDDHDEIDNAGRQVDDWQRHALVVPEPQRERPERPIDTTIRSEPSHAYPRRWHGEEVGIEVTQEFERIKR